MKQSITYQAIANSGTTYSDTYYWNGISYAIEPFYFSAISEHELLRAKNALTGAPAMWPESYNFGINNLNN